MFHQEECILSFDDSHKMLKINKSSRRLVFGFFICFALICFGFYLSPIIAIPPTFVCSIIWFNVIIERIILHQTPHFE